MRRLLAKLWRPSRPLNDEVEDRLTAAEQRLDTAMEQSRLGIREAADARWRARQVMTGNILGDVLGNRVEPGQKREMQG